MYQSMPNRDPAEAAALLADMAKLLELSGENPFKTRAFERAAENISATAGEELERRARDGTFTEIPGVGKAIAEVLAEFVLSGTSRARSELIAHLPQGLLELVKIPGLGPKKARLLLSELHIKSIDGLAAACLEGRVARVKGFSEKSQKTILDGIALVSSSAGRMRLVDALEHSGLIIRSIAEAVNRGRHPAAGVLRVCETGTLRRRLETVEALDFLVELPPGRKHEEEARKAALAAVSGYSKSSSPGAPVRVDFAATKDFGSALVKSTGTPEFLEALGARAGGFASEEDWFKNAGVPFVAPELREGAGAVEHARAGRLEDIVSERDVQGTFHNHTTWSDGRLALEELVMAAARMGYRYIGIADHSQSAHYARGLKPTDVLEQAKEVEAVRKRHKGIRIFHGIESDIRADGSLDYGPEILSVLDFVVASVHSGFKMSHEEMTARVMKALKNPFTRILAHPTGRLLLERRPYDVDVEALIAEASRTGVAVEINANPARLDLDWRHGPHVRKTGCMIAINADAHDEAGLHEAHFGVTVARKMLLPRAQLLNALEPERTAAWLRRS